MISDKEFLQFIHDRLEFVHGEEHNDDYVIRLREIISRYNSDRINYVVIESNKIQDVKKGSYPIGATEEEVRVIVKGPYGGHFRSFENGKFIFVAYTD